MTVVDDIHYIGREEHLGIPGGPGLWATFGARLFKDGFSSKEVGCILVPRTDFAPELLETLRDWDMTMVVRESRDQVCTKARQTYHNAFEGKVFTYLNEKLAPRVWDLDHTDLLGARSFHFLALPNQLTQQLSTLDFLRGKRGFYSQRLITWEPASEACNQAHLIDILRTIHHVDIFSPSHDELINMTVGSDAVPDSFSPRIIQEQSERFIKSGIGHRRKGIIIVRCGFNGIFYMKSEKEKGWARSWDNQGTSMPRDITGSGSAFLGAFTVCYEATEDIKKACLHGMMAASFAMMQFGFPRRVEKNSTRVDAELGPFCYETWNTKNPFYRLCLKEVDEDIFYQRPFC
ncbi:Ribokinase-like protein [Xylaria arbuscula]|nr:Ribokinase-like protein [Xylaria arbuscula]